LYIKAIYTLTFHEEVKSEEHGLPESQSELRKLLMYLQL
jgi:hypothetical protein